VARYVDERGDVVSTDETNRTVEMSGVRARQGLLGRPVLMVLICGLLLALIAWAGAEMFGERLDKDAATRVQENAPAADVAAPSNQGTVDNTQTTGNPSQMAPAGKNPTPQTGSGG